MSDTVIPTVHLRFVERDGKRILQQMVWSGRGHKWRDVPTEKEKSDE